MRLDISFSADYNYHHSIEAQIWIKIDGKESISDAFWTETRRIFIDQYKVTDSGGIIINNGTTHNGGSSIEITPLHTATLEDIGFGLTTFEDLFREHFPHGI